MIGETILHYKILEKLGRGGMGLVYRIYDLLPYSNLTLRLLLQNGKTDSCKIVTVTITGIVK